jgi:hypothetical protein
MEARLPKAAYKVSQGGSGDPRSIFHFSRSTLDLIDTAYGGVSTHARKENGCGKLPFLMIDYRNL